LLSPFEDARWGATGTQQFLKSIGSKLVLAERGMTGALGDFSWQVVSPERGAAGAEDSNDASIVMLWSCDDFSLITMADIGERGQMRMISKSPWWKSQRLQMLPLILKVSHHGSADQYPELIDALAPDLSLVSVGQNNSYGHPTLRILTQLKRIGSKIARTDELGSIAISAKDGGLMLASSG
jgi:competence protein ComEC